MRDRRPSGPDGREGVKMITIRSWIALSIVCTAAPTIFLASTPAAARQRSVEVGPIWNQVDADRKCREAARREGGAWTGQWRTTRPGQMSECDIKMEHHEAMRRIETGPSWMEHGHHHHTKAIEVGPIWNQMDADRKCPEAARRVGGTWTGQWRTTRPGQMSECDIKR